MRTITSQEQALVAGGNPVGDFVTGVGQELIRQSNTLRQVPVVGATAADQVYSVGRSVWNVGSVLNCNGYC
jgi:hypothetical protein